MFDAILYYGSVALAVYKAFAIILIFLSVLGIAYVAQKSAEMRRVKKTVPVPENILSERVLSEMRDTTITRWHQIVERLGNQPDIKDFKTAIIEADGLVDAALR